MKPIVRQLLLCSFLPLALAFAGTGPARVGSKPHYLFYLHGQIVEGSDGRPVSPEFGPYEYKKIVETLTGYGFVVRSEIRPANADPKMYAEKIVGEIQQLLQAGVPERDIAVVGASKGGVIAAFVSSHLTNPDISYVILAGFFTNLASEKNLQLHGRVLSIHDASDKNRISSEPYFKQSPALTEKKAIVTKTGLGHGLIFQPHPEWVIPAMEWLQAGKP